MKSAGSILRTLLLVVCVGAAAYEGFLISRLTRENQDLRTLADKAKATAEAKAAKEMSKRNMELRVLRVQNQDMLKLRTELRQLRPLTNEVVALRAQLGKAKAGGAVTQPVPRAAAVENDQGIVVARDDWSFAGYSNPEASLETVVWAGSQGDLEVFLTSLTPDGRVKLEDQAQKQTKSAEDMVADLKQGFTKFTGFRILEQTTLPDDSVMMRVQMEGQNLVERFFFKKIGDDWKMSESKEDK